MYDEGVWIFDHWKAPEGVTTQRTLAATVPVTDAAYIAQYVYDRPAQRVLLPEVTR